MPVGDDRTIGVRGYYANDVYRNITLAALGTTYTSSDPAIVTVNPEGVLTPVSPGVTYIVVDHRGVKAFAQVEVLGPDGADLPPTDQTAKVVIDAGGFRLDRASGRYLQSVTIQNTSALPLWFPLNLVVADLPAEVELRSANGLTKIVPPLGLPRTSLYYADAVRKDFFMPGDTLTVILSFVNNTGVPITYTPRVYSGWP